MNKELIKRVVFFLDIAYPAYKARFVDGEDLQPQSKEGVFLLENSTDKRYITIERAINEMNNQPNPNIKDCIYLVFAVLLAFTIILTGS